MIYTRSDTQFDYFSTPVVNGRIRFNLKGFDDEEAEYGPFVINAGFDTPDWSKGALMYQIFVDRFYNGSKDTDEKDGEYVYLGKPVKHKDWDELPESFDVANFYGGDLKGVLLKLDYLQKLGVEVIYFNPIFTSPSNHKYDVEDYRQIDPFRSQYR